MRQLEILQLSLKLTVAGDGCINHTGQVRESHESQQQVGHDEKHS